MFLFLVLSSQGRWLFITNHYFMFYCPISFTFLCKVSISPADYQMVHNVCTGILSSRFDGLCSNSVQKQVLKKQLEAEVLMCDNVSLCVA